VKKKVLWYVVEAGKFLDEKAVAASKDADNQPLSLFVI
jgi:hypothetical protein